MLIGIDARSVGKKVCGVSRVAVCLVEALARLDHDNRYIVYTNDNDFPIPLPENFRVTQTGCNRMNATHDYRFARFLKRDKPDLLHVMHSWLPLSIPAGIRTIVTIYDIFTVTDPDFFKKRRPLHRLFREYFRIITWLTVRRADAIVTISEFCKHEIERVFGSHNKQIEVVYMSPGIVPKEQGGERVIPEPYLLYLGNFRSYKNVELLVRGYALHVARHGVTHRLVLAGNDKSETIEQLVRELKVEENVSFLLRPDDDIVDSLFRHASAFIFPSKFEGFGIPPLEAMQYGIPVMVSDAEALVETSGEAALVFDRTSPSDLAGKLHTLLTNPALQDDLVRRGKETVARFRWEPGALKLLQMYTSHSK
jgi:glycosyltransferase involved in cell wall biosynthesis